MLLFFPIRFCRKKSPQGRFFQFKRPVKEVGFMTAKRALIMHPKDNVATTVEEIQPGDPVQVSRSGEVRTLIAIEPIPFGFKIALEEIPQGAFILKYGDTIGKASRAIPKGALVHVHNLEGTRARGDLEGREKR
jgi:altronate dehydratase small subunit